MARHAIVNKENVVVNVIIWEGKEWLPQKDHFVIHCDSRQCDIGDIYDTKTFSFSRPKNQKDE